MIEFEPHDYFTGKTDRKVSRELFQEHIRKTYDQIRELADYIEQYEGTIDTEFKKIVTHVNEQVKQLTDLYNDLLDNNVLDSAIQEKLLQLEQNYTPRLSTLEQNDVSLTAQLQQKVGGGKLASLDDLDGEVISAIEGGEGTEFNLLSIPKDDSVTMAKINSEVYDFNGYLIEFDGGFRLSFHIPDLDITNVPFEVSFDVTTVDLTNDVKLRVRAVGSNSATGAGDFIGSSFPVSYDFPPQSKTKIVYSPSPLANKDYEYVQLWISFDGNVSRLGLEYATLEMAGNKYVASIQKNLSGGDLAYAKVSGLPNQIVTYEKLNSVVKSIGVSERWEGKVWSALGDSITNGVGTSSTYVDKVSERLMTTEANALGVNNSTITGTSTTLPSFTQRYVNIPKNSDLITVFGGINDMQNNKDLGQIGDTTKDTFYGALKVLCEGLSTDYPEARIAFFTPIKSFSQTDTNARGHHEYEYVNAIKEICGQYSIPVLDLFSTAGIDATNPSHSIYFSGDGYGGVDNLHPNENGHERITSTIVSFLESL